MEFIFGLVVYQDTRGRSICLFTLQYRDLDNLVGLLETISCENPNVRSIVAIAPRRIQNALHAKKGANETQQERANPEKHAIPSTPH